MDTKCMISDCPNTVRCKGYCIKHYDKYLRYGDAAVSKCSFSWADPMETRFWSRVAKTEGCWFWTGACNGSGYGAIKVNGRQVNVHRLSYELAYGPIPNRVFVLHRCDNTKCVRPDHLFLGTHLDNIRDKVSKNRQPFGSNHSHAKLTENDIRLIRKQLAAGLSPKAIAQQYGVSKGAIYNIANGLTWQHTI